MPNANSSPWPIQVVRTVGVVSRRFGLTAGVAAPALVADDRRAVIEKVAAGSGGPPTGSPVPRQQLPSWPRPAAQAPPTTSVGCGHSSLSFAEALGQREAVQRCHHVRGHLMAALVPGPDQMQF